MQSLCWQSWRLYVNKYLLLCAQTENNCTLYAVKVQTKLKTICKQKLITIHTQMKTSRWVMQSICSQLKTICYTLGYIWLSAAPPPSLRGWIIMQLIVTINKIHWDHYDGRCAPPELARLYYYAANCYHKINT